MSFDSNQRNQQLSSSEIFHHDEKGYGPRGEFTRREWRKKCLDNLLAGAEAFLTWQNSWLQNIDTSLADKNFEIHLTYNDGTILKILSGYLTRPYAIDFSGHVFESEVFLHDYDFIEETLFSGTEFRSMAYFGGAIFNKNTDFEYGKFLNTAFFESAIFSKGANFDNIIFFKSAHFRKCIFHKHANFENSFFNDYVDFKGVVFKNSVDFAKVKFVNGAYFYECNFENANSFIEFSNAEFNENLNFHHSKIAGYFSLNKAIVRGNVDFNNTIFSSSSYFTKSQFQGQYIFVNAVFENKCNFENAVFENLGHFEGVFFKKSIPAFRGCKIDATRLEFSDGTKFPDDDIEDGAIENASFLKRLSDEHGQTDQALRFNAIELRLKRLSSNADIGFKVVTWFYEKLSNYGRSFMRPLIAYLVLFLITLGIGYWCASQTAPAISKCGDDVLQVLNASFKWKCLDYSIKNKDDIELDGYRAAFEFAAYRGSGIIDFLDNDKQTAAVSQRVFGQPIEPGWARAWGIFKAIASTALLFLAALGLRNKYRIK